MAFDDGEVDPGLIGLPQREMFRLLGHRGWFISPGMANAVPGWWILSSVHGTQRKAVGGGAPGGAAFG
jgi:hypothetical protein